MKNLIKKASVFILAMSLSLISFSCENENSKEEVINVEKSDGSSYSMKSTSYSYEEKIRNYFEQDFEIAEAIVVTDGLFSGRKLIVNGEEVGVVVNDSDGLVGFADLRVASRIKYFDLRKDRLFDMPFILNEEHGILVPDFNGGYYTEVKDNRCQGQFTLCSAVCTIAAVAVAASDGPIPLMDVLAVSGWTLCQGGCLSAYDLCVNPPKN